MGGDVSDLRLKIVFRRIATILGEPLDYCNCCRIVADLAAVPFDRVFTVCIECSVT